MKPWHDAPRCPEPDWEALGKLGPCSTVWSMPGWHGLRWALMRGDGEGKPIPEPKRRYVTDAMASATRPVSLNQRGPVFVDPNDMCPTENLHGRYWSPDGLDLLASVSESAKVGSFAPHGRTIGVLVGFGSDGEPTFILIARGAP